MLIVLKGTGQVTLAFAGVAPKRPSGGESGFTFQGGFGGEAGLFESSVLEEPVAVVNQSLVLLPRRIDCGKR